MTMDQIVLYADTAALAGLLGLKGVKAWAMAKVIAGMRTSMQAAVKGMTDGTGTGNGVRGVPGTDSGSGSSSISGSSGGDGGTAT